MIFKKRSRPDINKNKCNYSNVINSKSMDETKANMSGNSGDGCSEDSEDALKLMTFKDYVALFMALLSILLPWVLIFGAIFALVVFLLTRFWLKA
ncbi:MAG TPA: hypothetical protein PK733_00140 [Clostridiales bacterium]|nr:hypothetical protein [Clostridiales bacterium]